MHERTSKDAVERGLQLRPKFDSAGLIPCITQDAVSLEVLMFAYMNEEALRLTITTGYAHYFSRSRNALWKKGETSGHFQRVMSVRVDCDQDVILLRVEQVEAACHTGYRSCFFRQLRHIGAGSDGALDLLEKKPVFDARAIYSQK